MQKSLCHFIIAIVLASVMNVRAATITITADRDGYTGYGLSTGDVAGSGSQPTLLVGRTGTNFGIGLHFDVSAIPAGSTISSAVVRVYQTAGNTSLGINLRAIASGNWTESALSSQGWSTLTTSSGTDLGSTASTNLNTYNDVGNTALATQVSNWINTPVSNLGLLLNQSAYPGNTNKTFTARLGDSGNAAREPLLTITYTPVPEPASIGVIGLGGMMMLRRKRKN